LAFFGLKFDNAQEYKLSIYEQIHFIVINSNGGYTWNTIYNMPIWLRQWVYNKINTQIKNIQEQSSNILTADNIESFKTDELKKASPNIKVPDFIMNIKK
jgi:hypothetical protein